MTVKAWDELTEAEKAAAKALLDLQALEFHRQMAYKCRLELSEYEQFAREAASQLAYHEKRMAELEKEKAA